MAGLLLGGAGLLALTGLLARRLPPGPVLSLCLLGLGLPGIGATLLWLRGPAREPLQIGIWRYDARFGYAHRADTSGLHTHPAGDFAVRYRLDGRGHRALPAPEDPQGTVLCVGGSFTFGYGVADSACFPALLARRFPRLAFTNAAVMGWGTVHAWLAVEDAFAEAPPDHVLYGMIPHHIERNGLRASWVDFVGRATLARGHPHVELEDGRPVWKGVVHEGEADSPALTAHERALTRALLAAIARRCREAGARFSLVLLPQPDHDYPPGFVGELASLDLELVDLRALPFAWFPSDDHPSPADHRRIADALAGLFEGG